MDFVVTANLSLSALILYCLNRHLCFESVIILLSISDAIQTPFVVLDVAEPYYDS